MFDAAGGTVLGKAEVRLSGGPAIVGTQSAISAGPNMAVRTGADGAFLLEGLSPGEYSLSVNRLGFAACGAEVRGLGGRRLGCSTQFTLVQGQNIDGVEVRLLRAAVISGEVRDEDGEPMAGVVVDAEQYRYVRGTKVLAVSGRATTDDRGYYRIYNLSPGRYLVKAQGPGLIARVAGAIMAGGGPGGMGGFGRGGFRGPAEEAVSYPPTYYPSAGLPEESIPLQLTPGAEMGGIDFRLTPSSTYRIQGTVSSIGGEALTGVAVTARRAGHAQGLAGPTAYAPADGRSGTFLLRGLNPGRYELVARSVATRRNGESSGVSGRMLVDLGNAHVQGITISLRPDVQLQGRVLLPRGKDNAALERMRITLRSSLPGPPRTIRVDAEGNFRLTLPAADPLDFGVEGLPAGFYLKAAKVGGVDLLSEGAQPPAEIVGDMVLELGADGGTVQGVARNDAGKAAAGARAVLMPERTGTVRRLWQQTAVSADDGSFQFADVAPGRYRLYVFEDLDSGPATDADFLGNFGQRWKSVDVKPGATATPESPWVPATETTMQLGEAAP